MPTKRKTIRASKKETRVIAMSAPVSITAGEVNGDKKGPPKFTVVAYTGQPMNLNGWDLPVVVDIEGMEFADTLIANLDHDKTKRVGHVVDAVKQDGKVLLTGIASAVSAAKDEVVASGENGYPWKASIEADPLKVKEIAKGKTLKANGREFPGPLYYVPESLLSGFGFVTRGADSKTEVAIAAIAANQKENEMDAKLQAWIEDMLPGTDVDHLSAETLAKLEADYKGQSKKTATKPKTRFKEIEAEAERAEQITEYAEQLCAKRKYDREYISAVKELTDQAIEAGWSLDKFRLEALEASIPLAGPPTVSTRDRGMSNRMLEAAIAESGRLPEKDQNGRQYFTDQEMQAAHDRFKGRIGLKEVFLICAQANGYRSSSLDVTIEAHNAAFGLMHQSRIQATGFSALDISTILSNTANKFVMRGWNMVDQTPLKISKIQNVKDFKTITTVSLTDSVRYEQLGPDGEIKHGTLSNLSYTNKADTYAKMLAITRQDIINDDLGALTDVPMKLGNGAMKLLNHIFWTEFLSGVSTSFFASGNNNINTGVADMTLGGLDATETIFANQTNPDGTPLGIQPAILLVPTALKNKAIALMSNESKVVSGNTAGQSDVNVFAGRFRVESSPYISNSTYTGNTAQAWWMLADPNELPVIAIAALNGRVEPTVETADADFNVLGVQMRGYSDVGVNFQEYRGGVHADGNAS